MTTALKDSPLHFHPLRPSRDHLDAVSWSERPVQRSGASSPFAYIHEPFVGDDYVGATTIEEMGSYNPETQRWEFPDGAPSLGVYTKTNAGSTPPTASYPGEQPDVNWVTDDACS